MAHSLALRHAPWFRRSFWMPVCWCRTASSRADPPLLSLWCTSVLLSSRNWTSSWCPSDEATCRAVRPLWSGTLGEMPLEMRFLTSPSMLLKAALQSSTPASDPWKWSLPPFSRRIWATASCLCRIASLSGVLRNWSSALTSAPWLSRNLTMSTCPSEAATCNAVRRSESLTLTLSFLRACFMASTSPLDAAVRMSLVRSCCLRLRRASTRWPTMSKPTLLSSSLLLFDPAS
mmetsp:Transcript_67385/g.179929  ORF Transcript_67385/g.179929 Transcript_67385/m.179929 type:complete len:232 (-) Transcript_67385:6444-7139(-)